MVLMEKLQRAPNTSFEKDVICEEEDSFLLSSKKMTELEVLYKEVKFRSYLTYVYCIVIVYGSLHGKCSQSVTRLLKIKFGYCSNLTCGKKAQHITLPNASRKR